MAFQICQPSAGGNADEAPSANEVVGAIVENIRPADYQYEGEVTLNARALSITFALPELREHPILRQLQPLLPSEKRSEEPIFAKFSMRFGSMLLAVFPG